MLSAEGTSSVASRHGGREVGGVLRRTGDRAMALWQIEKGLGLPVLAPLHPTPPQRAFQSREGTQRSHFPRKGLRREPGPRGQNRGAFTAPWPSSPLGTQATEEERVLLAQRMMGTKRLGRERGDPPSRSPGASVAGRARRENDSLLQLRGFLLH